MSGFKLERAILGGASGLTGGHIAAALVAAGVHVAAVVRRPVSTLPPEVVQASAPPAEPADAVFCAIGTTIAKAGSRQAFRAVDYDAVMTLARWGHEKCGARQFVLVSSVDASPSSPNFYLRVKGETERDLGTVGYESLHLFRPSFLLGERAEPRFGEQAGIAIARTLSWALAGPLAKYKPIQARDVAQAMVNAAARPPSAPGPVVYHYREIRALLP